MNPSLAISIPAYNEEGTIEPLVRESLAVLQKHTEDFEVVIIDDGSTDRTGALCDALSRENPRIRVFHHERNLGFGPTLREVFTKPSKEWVFFIPGDGQIPPRELDTLLPAASRADFILGWRRHRADAAFRRLAAFLYNLFISAAAGRRLHDVDSVVLFRRALAEDLPLQSQSVFLHAEFCLRALLAGASLAEIPIQHQSRTSGVPKSTQPGVVWHTMRECLQFFLRPRA